MGKAEPGRPPSSTSLSFPLSDQLSLELARLWGRAAPPAGSP